MSKIAVLVLAEEGSHESLGRIVNALEFAKELDENDHDVRVIFDGAGTTFIPELEKEDHKAHPLYKTVLDNVDGACKFCSNAFGVFDEVESSNVDLLDDYDDHPSLESYVAGGYQVVTF